MHRPLSSFALLAGLGALACGGDAMTGADAAPRVPTAGTTPATVASVEVLPSAPTVAVGATLQLAAVARDRGGVVVAGRPTAWASTDSAVAVVSPEGLVTGAGVGVVRVTVRAGGFETAFAVRVEAPAAAPVATTPATPDPAPGPTAAPAPSPDPEPAPVGPPDTARLVVGANQRASAGAELAEPLVAQVLDRGGRPVPGYAVTFRVTAGGGRMAAGAVRTNQQGVAEDRWTLGTDASAAQRVEVQAVDGATGATRVLATFTADASPGAPASVLPAAGSGHQQVVVGGAAPLPPAVHVTDAHGNPIAGVAVTFRAAPGNGTVDGTAGVTDAAGRFAVGRWTIDTSTAVPYRLTARVAGVDSAVFVAQPVAAPAAKLVLTAGGDQTAIAGRVLPDRVHFMVADRYGNRVFAGATYDAWAAVYTGNGHADASSTGTSLYAIAWRLSTTPGPNTMTISLPGFPGIAPATAKATGTTP